MEESIDKIKLKGIDKSDWITYRFDQITFSINERVEPTQTDLEIYVGLEHLDPESIHIKRFGKREDVKGTKLRVYPGDIIFGRRRAYQRKAAIAEFDGFCSAHALVLRANQEVIDPKLFPFFLHSDTFMNRAIDISVGSLSPTINWGTLKKQEFLLPPKEQQACLAELLWTADEVVESYLSTLLKSQSLLDINANQLIWKINDNYKPIVTCVSPQLGKFIDGDWIESKDQSPSGIRLIQLADIGIGKFLNKSSRFISKETFDRLNCFEVLPNDILVARMPEPIGRACIIPDIGKKMITAVDCCIIRVDKSRYSNRYLMYLFNTSEMMNKIQILSSGTTRQRISRKNLERIQVPLPDYEKQLSIVKKLDFILSTIDALNVNEEDMRRITNSLLNQIF